MIVECNTSDVFMDTGKGLVSIIVPVYNAEKFLCKCFDGILIQTYTNWELLLVDDGSTDNSWNICEGYSKKDERIIAIHKDNSGVSDTRNVGIAHSTGDNICFVDADDWVKPNYIEHLMQFSEYDFVIAGYETWPEKSKCFLKDREYKREEMASMFDEFLQTRPTSCASLFKSKIIKEHQIQFNSKLRSREDHLFNVQYLHWCNSTRVINYQEYVVRSRRVPIAIKFRMHSSDITLVIDSLLKGYKEIESEFGYKIKNLIPTLNIMSQYYLEDFIRYQSDDDYFGIYRCYYHTDQKEEMYANKSLNSMNLMMDGIMAYRQVKNRVKMQELIATYELIFKNVSIHEASFKSFMYQSITDSILKGQNNITAIKIEIEHAITNLKSIVRNTFRPLLYKLKA